MYFVCMVTVTVPAGTSSTASSNLGGPNLPMASLEQPKQTYGIYRDWDTGTLSRDELRLVLPSLGIRGEL